MPLTAEQQACWNVYDVHQYVEMANGLYRAGLHDADALAAEVYRRAPYALLVPQTLEMIRGLAVSVIADRGTMSANPANPFGPKSPL